VNKNFNFEEHQSTKDYTNIQHKKYLVLYAMFAEQHKQQANKSQNFFEFLAEHLRNSKLEEHVRLGIDGSFAFTLNLIK